MNCAAGSTLIDSASHSTSASQSRLRLACNNAVPGGTISAREFRSLAGPAGHIALFNECASLHLNNEFRNSMAAKIFHPLLALIASASNNELAKYVEFLKEENKIPRASPARFTPSRMSDRDSSSWGRRWAKALKN